MLLVNTAFKRLSLFIALVVSLASLQIIAHAQDISVRFDFQFIRQGQVGLLLVSGSDLTGGVANIFDRNYTCYPTSQGAACLIAVPMDKPIKDYPISLTISKKDGSTIPWKSQISVQLGQFLAETFVLPGNLLYLLRDDIQANEDDRLMAAYSIVTPTRYWEGTFTPPVNPIPVSPYGAVRTYNGGQVRRHTGQDLRALMGTPVLASASGRVVLSRPMDIHGNNIVIDHGWGIYTEYAHLSERYVVPGQFVLQGDVLGLSGNTGRSTGPHVHWEVAVGGVWVNPLAFAQLKLPQ